MEYVLILATSVGVGVLVYRLSVRVGGASRSSSVGAVAPAYDDAQGEPVSPGAGTAYLPVSTSAPSWQTRLIGLIGLVLMVAMAGALLAVALYQAGALIARLMSQAADSGAATGTILLG
jgi:hypothetical protein